MQELHKRDCIQRRYATFPRLRLLNDIVRSVLTGCGTSNNLDQLACNDGLTCSVVKDGELANHVAYNGSISIWHSIRCKVSDEITYRRSCLRCPWRFGEQIALLRDLLREPSTGCWRGRTLADGEGSHRRSRIVQFELCWVSPTST